MASPIALLDTVSFALVSVSRAGDVLYLNRSAKEILHHEGTAVGAPVLSLFNGSRPLEAAMAAVGSQELRISFAHNRADGSQVELGMTVSGSPRLPDGTRYLLQFRNLSTRFGPELKRRERYESVGRLAAGYAHELRNPLSAIQGLAELTISELPETEPARDYLGRILVLVGRIERLVKAALDYAEPAPASARLRHPMEVVDQVLKEMASLWRWGAAGPRVECRTSTRMWADPDQACECLRVLLQNALEAVESADQVLIRVSDSDGVVSLSVHDCGPGIPPYDLERIFDPFYTTKAKGTGLGLAVAQAAAIQNGGTLSVSSRPGSTVFRLLLPSGPIEKGV